VLPKLEAPATRRALFFAALALYLVLSAIKMRGYLGDGRFWAEEGLVFFTQIAALPLWQRPFFLYYGHLELPANVVIALSTLVPFRQAPLVTTYLSFALQSLPLLLLLWFRRELLLPAWAMFAMVVVYVGLPQATEVWATSINLHFFFSLLAALICALEPGPAPRRWWFRVLLAVCGLSGIPANFMAPMYLVRAVRSGDRERWIQFAILAATAAVQGTLLVANSAATGPRSLALDPRIYWLAMVSQDVLSPLFGFGVGDALAEILRRVLGNDAGAALFALLCTLPLVYAVAVAKREGAWGLRRTLVASAVLLAVLSILGSIGDKQSLISAAGGGRYFFAPNVLLAVFFMGLGIERDRLAQVFLALLLLTSASQTHRFFGGVPWSIAYDRARSTNASDVEIWPSGWRMPMPR